MPAGKWLTGRIELKSNVNLRIDEGAELHFSGQIEDYLPAVPTRNEGVDIISTGAMVYANGAKNIAITGKGRLVAPRRDCQLMRRAIGQNLSSDDSDFSARLAASLHSDFVSRTSGVIVLRMVWNSLSSVAGSASRRIVMH